MNTSEDEVIARLRAIGARQARGWKALRLVAGDDAAIFLPRPGYETLLTCDWFLERTHFLPTSPPDAVGWKCLARAVSDLAAMGGQPRCFLLSLALPRTRTAGWLDGFLAGLDRAARKLRCPLAGGDTTRRREILISVTVVGEVRRGFAVLRSGARPGDLIFASGRLGEAGWGLSLLRKSRRSSQKLIPAIQKHLYPEPRLALGQWLARKRLATAMMDLSDGLSTDLPRLCAASGVGARIRAACLPTLLSSPSRRDKDAPSQGRSLALALNGGDDYELLFTVRPATLAGIPASFQGLPLTQIGEITAPRSLVLESPSGREQRFSSHGWDPFRN